MSKFTSYITRFAELITLRVQNTYGRQPVLSAEGPVVSLTTHGPRTQNVYLTLESIARGTQKPSRLILWLDNPAIFKALPKTLTRLIARGLEVRLCENFGPHTKYFPYVEMSADFSAPLVTADDDILYPAYWLDTLHRAHLQQPQYIHCFRARTITFQGDTLAPYKKWLLTQTDTPSLAHIATGVSGTLYPPAFLSILKQAGRGFIDITLKNDDLWLHMNAVKHGVLTHQLFAKSRHFEVTPSSQKYGLLHQNFEQNLNDRYILATYQAPEIARIRSALGLA